MAGDTSTERQSDSKRLNTAFGLQSAEAAHYLGVSVGTVRRWADEGHLSCRRTPGGQRRFSRDQLDALINAKKGGDNGSK